MLRALNIKTSYALWRVEIVDTLADALKGKCLNFFLHYLNKIIVLLSMD